MTPYITGQVFTRDVGEKEGRRLIMVVGILAMPPDDAYKAEHQYPVLGFNNGQLTIDTAAALDRTQEARGLDADGLLRAPLWRV